MKYNIELTDKDLSIIMYGLQKLPYETVHELIRDLVKQVNAQSENKTDITT
jgi:hypothetical protein